MNFIGKKQFRLSENSLGCQVEVSCPEIIQESSLSRSSLYTMIIKITTYETIRYGTMLVILLINFFGHIKLLAITSIELFNMGL